MVFYALQDHGKGTNILHNCLENERVLIFILERDDMDSRNCAASYYKFTSDFSCILVTHWLGMPPFLYSGQMFPYVRCRKIPSPHLMD